MQNKQDVCVSNKHLQCSLMPLTQSQISKDAKTTWSSNGEPHTSHFPNFPFTCKAPSRVHGKFLHADTAACHICSRLLAESVHKDTKLYSSRNRALSFSKSNCQRAHTHRPIQTATHPAKLIAWNQTQTNLRHAYKQKQTELAVLWSATTGYHLTDKVLQ